MALQAPKPVLRRKEKPRGSSCLNCREGIDSRYCPHCGQENAPADLSLFAVLKEFFNEIFYYDSKLWRTLRTLVAHPGRLSTEWSQGRRATYLSPIRLYLSITFLFFVAAAWHGGGSVNIKRALSPGDQEAIVKQLQTQKLAPTEISLIRSQLQKVTMTPENRAKIDAELDAASKRAEASGQTTQSATDNEGGPLFSSTRATGWFKTQILKIEAAAKDNPQRLQQLYVDQFPKVLFIILPLFAVALKLLYWPQRRYFVEHLVFILHLHSFAFLVFLPLLFIPGKFVPDYAVPFILFLWMPVYAFVAMLRFYKQPWWMTLIKGGVLSVAYSLLLAAGALLGLVFTVYKLDDSPSKPGAPAASTPATPGPAGAAQSDKSPA